LEAWSGRLKKIGATISTQVAEGWEEINKKIQTSHQQWLGELQEERRKLEEEQQQRYAEFLQQRDAQLSELEQMLAELVRRHHEQLADIAQQRGQHEAELLQLRQQQQAELDEQREQQFAQRRQEQEEQMARFQENLQDMTDMAMQLQQTLATLGQQSVAVQSELVDSVNGSAQTLDMHFLGLQRGLESLSGVLERLGEQQVVVQQVEPPKRGWFSRGRASRLSRNGR
jgi:chromosome segregation ATPase